MFQLNSVLFFFCYTFNPRSFSHFGLGWGLFWGVETWEREGGSVGNTFLIMLLSKGISHLFVHLFSVPLF